ncbi:bZIP transcription factor 29 [Linum grandiflorum]
MFPSVSFSYRTSRYQKRKQNEIERFVITAILLTVGGHFALYGTSPSCFQRCRGGKTHFRFNPWYFRKESGWGIVEGTGEKRGEATDEMMSGYMHMDNVDPLNSSGTEDNKDLDSGTKTNGTESSDNEAESHHVKGLKRSADADIGPAGRHSRSVSMDSFMGGLRLDEESMIMKLPPMGVRVSPSSSSSMQGHLTKFNLEFGNGEFTEGELKKIMSNDKLTELAMADPKRVKRILANRLSAARSKERKMRYIAELELKVQGLQAEATTLSAQVTVLQRDSANLTSQNNELKFRLQSIEQQTQLKDVFFTTWMQT